MFLLGIDFQVGGYFCSAFYRCQSMVFWLPFFFLKSQLAAVTVISLKAVSFFLLLLLTISFCLRHSLSYQWLGSLTSFGKVLTVISVDIHYSPFCLSSTLRVPIGHFYHVPCVFWALLFSGLFPPTSV